MRQARRKDVLELSPENGRLIWLLMTGHRKVEDIFEGLIPHTLKWIASCYHEPREREKVMAAINELLGCHGVEAIESPGGDSFEKPLMEYCNTGDSYCPTVVRDHCRGRWLVCGWADWVEDYERAGRKLP